MLDLGIDQSAGKSNSYMMLSKVKPVVISSDNFASSVIFTPLEASPVDTLYKSLHSAFGPLLKDKKWGVTSKLESSISELEANLASSLQKGPTSGVVVITVGGEDAFLHINSLEDEFNYWSIMSDDASNSKLRNRAKFFVDALKPLKVDFSKLAKASIQELSVAAEKVQDSLDEIWRQQLYDPISQGRITNILDIVVEQLISAVQSKVGQHLMDFGENNVAEQNIRAAVETCECIQSVLDTLTAKIWPNTRVNAWAGEPYISKPLQNLTNRLKDFLNIRTSHELLTVLLDDDAAAESNSFYPFQGFDPLDSSPSSAAAWEVGFR
jgi:Dynein heavy chain, N-terminal region 1